MLGVSNISFGLPAAAREVVNSVFLYYATKAGLDLAIVNAREAGALRIDSGGRAAAGGEPAVQHAAAASIPAPEDWREQTREQKIAINQFHIAAITEHFRRAGQEGQEGRPPNCRSTSAWRTTSSKAPRTA